MKKPPPAPLLRVIRDGVSVFCKKCNSTKSREYWLFGKRYCDNNKCEDSKPEKVVEYKIKE